MRATLFFSTLKHGRNIDRRKKFRNYYEMCRVSFYPTGDEKTRENLDKYFYENSLSDLENRDRVEFMEATKEKVKSRMLPTSSALDFFKSTRLK